MSEGPESETREGTFVRRYTAGKGAGEVRKGSRYPEKQGERTGSSRYPEKNVWNPQPVQREKLHINQESARKVKVKEHTAGDGTGRNGAEKEQTAGKKQTAALSESAGFQNKTDRKPEAAPREEQGIGAGGNTAEQRENPVPRNRKTDSSISNDMKKNTWQQKLRARKIRRLRIAGGCFLGVILVVYLAVAVYFRLHFYEGTMIYGVDCSQMTAQEAKDSAADRLEDYVLTLQERGNVQETISARQIELKFEDNGSFERALKAQKSYLWPVMILLPRSSQASVSFSFSEEKAVKLLKQMDCFNDMLIEAPQDAYIGIGEHEFEVVPEVQGTTLDQAKAEKAVLKALNQGDQTLSFEEEGCYVAPKICQDDEQLVRDTAAMNELVQADITYDFGDRTEKVDVSVMKDWIVKLDEGSFVIDDSKVSDFVQGLAEKYDTFGMSRDFYTSYGTVVSLNGGDYGWAIDQDATTVELLRKMEEGYQGVLEPEYTYTGMCRDTNDIGYTYVEICISQQRMFCYKDGNLIVDTPVVTGNPNKGNATPSGGVWAIDAKMRDYVLTGEGYQAPVDYWMPFNGNIGIHDLKERAYFGSTIYLTNGSHGCVNTPYDQVAIIYDAVSIGTPVIVYDTP